MFYTYKNCKILLNGLEVLATEGNISLRNELSPVYREDDRHSFYYSPDNGIGGTLGFTYYLTGQDPLKEFFNDETRVISGDFGGLYFNSGYLKSYLIDAAPNVPVSARAEVIFFDELRGEFSPVSRRGETLEFLNFADVLIENSANNSVGTLINAKSFSFNFESEIKPVYLEGDSLPDRIVFGRKSISAQVNCPNLSGNLAYDGNQAGLTITLRHPTLAINESFRIDGSLMARNFSTAANQRLETVLSISQHKVDLGPTVTGYYPISVLAGDTFRVSGTNLEHAQNIYIGDVEAQILSSSPLLITAIVPQGADSSGRLHVYSDGGSASSTGFIAVQQTGMVINYISTLSGAYGSEFQISGHNFYKISEVNIGTGNMLYEVISPNLLEVTVSDSADYGFIKIKSTGRNSEVTSSQAFVPYPFIRGFSPATGVNGAIITVSGKGFSGIQTAALNGLTGSISNVSNTGFQFVVPSGNVKGPLVVTGKSGVHGTSSINFSPTVSITGLSASFVATGGFLQINGSNFIPELLKSTPVANRYVIQFNGDTGWFSRVDNQTFTGLVPTGATNGFVNILAPDDVAYPSAYQVAVQGVKPLITGIFPLTGSPLQFIDISGRDFRSVTSVVFDGPKYTLVPSGQLSINSESTLINLQVPTGMSGGLYSVGVYTLGDSSVSGNAFYIKGIPSISGNFPISGGIGEEIRISGRNLYPDSKIYISGTGVQATVLTGNSDYSLLTFLIPTSAPVSGTIININDAGSGSGGNLIRIPAPRIRAFAPASGAEYLGVKVSGENFQTVTGIFFGNDYATINSIIGSTGISTSIPPGASTNYVYAASRGKLYQSDEKFTVTVGRAVASIISPTGALAGTEVSLDGVYLNNTTKILISGTGSTIIEVTGFTLSGTVGTFGVTGLYFKVPTDAVNGKVKLHTAGASPNVSTTSQTLYIISGASIDTVSAYSGVYQSQVSISGVGLNNRTIFFPGFNGRYVPALSQVITNDTGAVVKVPREINSGTILVSGDGYKLAYSADSFFPIPTISGFQPASGLTGATLVLTGINASYLNTEILGITGFGTFANIASSSLTVDPSRTTGANVVNLTTGYTLITVQTNANYGGTGQLFLITAADTGLSTNLENFSSSLTFGQIQSGKSSQTYNLYHSNPVITSYAPLSGHTSSLITLNGSNLLYTTGVIFNNGATSATATLVSQTQNQVTFYPPVFSLKSGTINVLTRFGSGATTPSFTYLDLPFISGFNPTQGQINSLVLISGRGLDGITGLTFGSVSASISGFPSGNSYFLNATVPDIQQFLPQEANLYGYSLVGSTISSNKFTITASSSGTYVLSASEKVFLVTIPTGADFLAVTYPTAFSEGSPKIELSIQLAANNVYNYMTAHASGTISGFTALFSDIVAEPNNILHVIAKI